MNDNIQTDLINVIPDKTSPKGVRAFPNYNPNWNKEQLKPMWFDKGISLQWNEVCNATSYNIYFCEEGDYFVKYLENISSTSAFIYKFPSFYISDYPNKSVYSYCLQGGVKYYFKISANFEKKEGNLSNDVCSFIKFSGNEIEELILNYSNASYDIIEPESLNIKTYSGEKVVKLNNGTYEFDIKKTGRLFFYYYPEHIKGEWQINFLTIILTMKVI